MSRLTDPDGDWLDVSPQDARKVLNTLIAQHDVGGYLRELAGDVEVEVCRNGKVWLSTTLDHHVLMWEYKQRDNLTKQLENIYNGPND